MKKHKLLQEPSFLWDLYFIFYWNFNSKKSSKHLLSNEKNAKTVDFFNNILLRFGNISDDLSIFFQPIGEENNTFIYDNYLQKFEKNFILEYNIEHLHQELSDKNQLIKNMIAFYLENVISGEDALIECFESKEVLFNHIKNSYYSAEQKLKLYEFFINPISYTNLLQRTIIEKQYLLSNYYNEHYKEILNAYDQSAINTLNESMNTTADDTQKEGDIYVSYCLIDKLHFESISNNNTHLYILGKDYSSTLEYYKKNIDEPLLENFCYALAEKNRVEILKLLYKGEQTCKDLERFFNFSGSTAYHHISLMTKSGLVKTRNEGKTIFYSVNKEYFNDIIRILRNLNNS